MKGTYFVAVFEKGKPNVYIGGRFPIGNDFEGGYINALVGIMDKAYQDIKVRQGITDESYIAFDEV